MEVFLIIWMLFVGNASGLHIIPVRDLAQCEHLGSSIASWLMDKEAMGKARVGEKGIHWLCIEGLPNTE